MENLSDDFSMDGDSSTSSEVSVKPKEARRSFRKNWNKPIYKYFKPSSSTNSSKVKCNACNDYFVVNFIFVAVEVHHHLTRFYLS